MAPVGETDSLGTQTPADGQPKDKRTGYIQKELQKNDDVELTVLISCPTSHLIGSTWHGALEGALNLGVGNCVPAVVLCVVALLGVGAACMLCLFNFLLDTL